MSEVVNLESKQVVDLDSDVNSIRVSVEWIVKVFGLICDLDLIIYCYDERVKQFVDEFS